MDDVEINPLNVQVFFVKSCQFRRTVYDWGKHIKRPVVCQCFKNNFVAYPVDIAVCYSDYNFVRFHS